MSKNLLIAFGIGLGCIAAAVGFILFVQRGAHLELPGQVLKVRTVGIEENSSVAMIDFRVSNTSDYPAIVRAVRVYCEDKSGARAEGTSMADIDSQRVFDGLPALGQKYNRSLILQDKIPGKATWDRMIGASFKLPEQQLQARRAIVIAIEEIDGKVFEIAENAGGK